MIFLNPTPITLAMDSVQTTKVHNHSQTRLNPRIYLKIKQRRFQRIFVDTDYTLNRKSVLQKYFGKKLLYVTRRSALVHAISSRKFVSEINFAKYNLKKYKSFSNRIFLDDPFLLRKEEYGKLFSNSVSKVTMDFYSYGSGAISLKSIKPSAKNIKHLKLILLIRSRKRHGKNDFFGMEYLRIVELLFPVLKHLETFTLQFISASKNFDYNAEFASQMEVFLSFLQKIVKLKTLRAINLDLYKLQIGCQFLKDLLFCLDTSQIEKWHFIGFSKEEMLDVKTIGPLLEKIDFLGLKFTTSDRDSRNYNYRDYMPPDLRRMPELTAKRKRILDLEMMYDDLGPTVELNEILSHGKSLEGLYIKSLCQERINWKMTDLTALAQVKDLILVWDKNQIYTNTIDDGLLKDFLSEFKKENSVLQLLKIFSRSTYENNFEERWTIPTYITDLNGMKSLEELTLYSDGEIDDAGDAFGSLTNLKRFTLNLCASNKKRDWNYGFPFKSLSRLTEFRLIIHPDMQTVEWNESFASQISLLPDLEVLEIIDDTNTIMPICALYSILKVLARFEKLRKLTLRAYIKKLVTKDALLIVGKKLYKARELKLIEDIKGKILRLISANPKLEKLDIGNFEGYKIPGIFYKKGYIKSK